MRFAQEGDPSTISLREIASGTAQDDSYRGLSREQNAGLLPNVSLAYCLPVATGAQDDSYRGLSREQNAGLLPNVSLAYCPPVATGAQDDS